MELIYHYTSVAGLKGILGQGTPTLRVTDSRYLNDSNEILRGVERAMNEISQSLSAKKYEEPIPNTIEFMERIINSIGRSLFFTASFCKEGDQCRGQHHVGCIARFARRIRRLDHDIAMQIHVARNRHVDQGIVVFAIVLTSQRLTEVALQRPGGAVQNRLVMQPGNLGFRIQS